MGVVGRLVALVTALALSAGCTSYKGSKDVASMGGGLIGGTLLIGIPIADKTDASAEDAAAVMVPLILIGLALGAIGIVGMGVHRIAGDDGKDDQVVRVTEPPAPPPVDPVAQRMAEEERRRRAAWDMTQQARIAAHRNDCQRVAYLAQRVIEVDRPTFDNVFARDPYIVKCAPKPPPEPPRAIPIPPLDPPIPPPVEPAPAEPTP
jgi:hypothetical protein